MFLMIGVKKFGFESGKGCGVEFSNCHEESCSAVVWNGFLE
jgi:hypothetical protein